MTYTTQKNNYWQKDDDGTISCTSIGCTCKRADVHPVEWGKCKGTCRK